MPLNRRHFLQYGIAASACSTFTPSAAATVVPEHVLRLGYTSSPTSLTGKMSETFAREVLQQTRGRIRVEVYFSGALGGEKEIAEDATAGVVDFALTSSAGYAGSKALPKLGIFDVPFLFRDLQHARSVLDGPIGETALRSLRSVGLEGLAWGENGFRQVTTTDKPIRSPSDLAGLKLRVPQSEASLAAFKGLGADAVVMPWPDVFAALADGRIAAQENGLNTIRTADLSKVQKYLCITDHVYAATMLMVSTRTLDALSPSDQQVIRQAARSTTAVARKINESTRSSDIADLAQQGMTVVSDVDRAAFIAANANMQKIYEDMFGREAIIAIQKFKG